MIETTTEPEKPRTPKQLRRLDVARAMDRELQVQDALLARLAKRRALLRDRKAELEADLRQNDAERDEAEATKARVREALARYAGAPLLLVADLAAGEGGGEEGPSDE